MEKIIDVITEKMVPIAEKLNKIKFLQSLAEAMMSIMSVTMVGAFACLFAFIDIGGWQDFLAEHAYISSFFMNVQSVTITIIAFYTLLALPYIYSEKLDLKNKLSVMILTVAGFLCLTPVELYASIPMEWLGHKGLFSVILVGFLVPRICKLCLDHNVTIKMPAGVPRAIESTFATLIPAFIVCFPLCLLGRFLQTTEFMSFHNVIYTLIQAPLREVGNTLPVLILMEMMSTLAMFCGIHGTSVTTWYTPLQTAVTQENLAAFTAGEPLPNIIIDGFTNTITIGGIGATLALAIVMLIVVKSKRYKEINKIAFIPQIFNISEPYLFGIPIMLNPILFLPYIGGVLFNCFSSYILVSTGIIARFTGVTVAWTVPSFIKCFLTCSVPWQGLALCLFNLAIDCLLWLPFIRILDKQALKEEAEGIEADADAV